MAESGVAAQPEVQKHLDIDGCFECFDKLGAFSTKREFEGIDQVLHALIPQMWCQRIERCRAWQRRRRGCSHCAAGSHRWSHKEKKGPKRNLSAELPAELSAH